MLKTILIVAAVALAGLLIFIAMQPSEFRVVRSATVAAPQETVFTLVNDLHRWDAWSPWARLDPGMKQTYEGPPAGVGAVCSWVGNSKVGEGRMTITESRPHDLVRLRLEFLKPFASTSDTELTFQPQGDRTALTWTMTGPMNFISKAMSLFMNMDKMIGGDFEKGLASLDQAAQSAK
jgi:hypothetical protein